jgi:DNA-binding NarL/FixJ family response regulator
MQVGVHDPLAPKRLTRRQFEILELAVQGYDNNEIARRLFISLHTVKVHMYKAFGELDVDNRTQAAVLLVVSGVVEGPKPVKIEVNEW